MGRKKFSNMSYFEWIKYCRNICGHSPDEIDHAVTPDIMDNSTSAEKEAAVKLLNEEIENLEKKSDEFDHQRHMRQCERFGNENLYAGVEMMNGSSYREHQNLTEIAKRKVQRRVILDKLLEK